MYSSFPSCAILYIYGMYYYNIMYCVISIGLTFVSRIYAHKDAIYICMGEDAAFLLRPARPHRNWTIARPRIL